MKTIVTGEYDQKLNIKLSQGTWNVTFFTLFETQKVLDVELPNDPSLYRLTVNYNSELFYFENILYLSNPNLDEISFYFYKEGNRIFCKIKSEIVTELNKEIVLNLLHGDIQEIKKIFENFNDENNI